MKKSKPQVKRPSLPFTIVSDSGKEYSPDSLPPRFLKVISYLDAFEDGKVMATMTLAVRLNISNLNHIASHPAINPYRMLYRGRMYWGNKRTIAAAKEQ